MDLARQELTARTPHVEVPHATDEVIAAFDHVIDAMDDVIALTIAVTGRTPRHEIASSRWLH